MTFTMETISAVMSRKVHPALHGKHPLLLTLPGEGTHVRRGWGRLRPSSPAGAAGERRGDPGKLAGDSPVMACPESVQFYECIGNGSRRRGWLYFAFLIFAS